jgi:hypothetical protein
MRLVWICRYRNWNRKRFQLRPVPECWRVSLLIKVCVVLSGRSPAEMDRFAGNSVRGGSGSFRIYHCSSAGWQTEIRKSSSRCFGARVQVPGRAANRKVRILTGRGRRSCRSWMWRNSGRARPIAFGAPVMRWCLDTSAHYLLCNIIDSSAGDGRRIFANERGSFRDETIQAALLALANI